MSKKILFFLVVGLFLNLQNIKAQEKTVSGTVTEAETDIPLPGVTVLVVGTNNGTATDFDGNYSLNVPDGATLEFTMVGFTSKVVDVDGQTTINVQLLADVEALNEVVVTALGIKRETKKLGYAMTEIQGEELAKTNTLNPVLGLQGKAAGVSIGSSDGGLFGNSKIQIRGVSSLNSANNQPIFVIDGVILNNDTSNRSADFASDANDYGNILKNLNPDDYKSVSVLKGAAATALYGSRGINGVVLIETKDGSRTRGIGVSLKQSIGVDQVYKQPGLQNEFGPGTLAGYVGYGEKDANDEYYRFDTNQFYYNEEGQETLINHAGGGLSYGPRFDGRDIIDYDGNVIPYQAQENNMANAYETGFNQNTAVSVSGGNEKGNFYLSDSYNIRTGVLPDNTFDRNSLLLRASYELAPWLEARGSISFTNSSAKNPRNDISQNYFEGGFERIYNTDKYSRQQYWQAPHGGIPSANYGDEYAFVPNKGLWFYYNTTDEVLKEEVTRPIVGLTATVTDWLTLNIEGNMNHYTTKFERKALGGGFSNEGGDYALNHSKDVSRTGKLSANFTPEFSENFSTQLLIGGEIWAQEKSYSNVRTDGGLIVPGRYYIENSKRTPLSSAEVTSTKQINSLYFLSSFGYRDQIFVDITGRNDWSSSLVYTNGSGNYSYFYPSVSSSWLFHETFNLPQWVTFGKLRASWAQVGSDTDPYAINRGYGIGSFEMQGGNFIYSNGINTTLVDRSIKPERKNSYEIGADIRLFNNRLGIDFAYYDEIISEQIGSIPLPGESGFDSYFTNIGTLSNSGYELSLTAVPVRNENVQWRSTFNYWRNTTKIKDLHEDYGEYKKLGGDITYGNFRIGSVAFEGGEYGILMSDSAKKEWQSTDANGNPIDDPRNGMPVLGWSDSRRGARYVRSGSVEEVGKIQPDFEGSFNNEFSYKGLDISVLLDARYGGHIASYSSRYGTSYGYLERSLRGRSPEHGGVSWTSDYASTQGSEYSDGIIPEGVFEEGTNVTTPSGSTVDIGGMTYQEAFDSGHVEPTHASYWNYFINSWGSGVVNDDWFTELKYIALRNVSVGYNLPTRWAEKFSAKNLYLGVNGRNLAYLYNSMPNDINPESFRGTSSTESFRERAFAPYLASYTFTFAVDF